LLRLHHAADDGLVHDAGAGAEVVLDPGVVAARLLQSLELSGVDLLRGAGGGVRLDALADLVTIAILLEVDLAEEDAGLRPRFKQPFPFEPGQGNLDAGGADAELRLEHAPRQVARRAHPALDDFPANRLIRMILQGYRSRHAVPRNWSTNHLELVHQFY